MVRSTGVALALFVCASQVFAHDAFLLDARRATAGPRLELVELPPTAQSKGRRYRLGVGPGLPHGVVFGVFTKPFDHGFHEAETGLQVDESGTLATREAGRKQTLDELSFGPGPYPAGAVWEVALVSADRAIRVFARVVPYPITAESGTCKVSLELASHLGDRFTASGTGFPPGEEVVTDQLYSGRKVEKRSRISPEGLLVPDLLTHRSVGADRGARYTVKATSCEVSIDYDWGEPALIRR